MPLQASRAPCPDPGEAVTSRYSLRIVDSAVKRRCIQVVTGGLPSKLGPQTLESSGALLSDLQFRLATTRAEILHIRTRISENVEAEDDGERGFIARTRLLGGERFLGGQIILASAPDPLLAACGDGTSGNAPIMTFGDWWRPRQEAP